jgi:hypothetical protein
MGIKARLTSWQASPPLRNSFVTIPGKPGAADFGSDSAERIITVKCNIYPKYALSSLVEVLDRMAEWLDPERTETACAGRHPRQIFHGAALRRRGLRAADSDGRLV